MKKIREQADFDAGQTQPSKLHTFDRSGSPQEFSDRGRADLKVRRNDPRFADNPMEDEQVELDEFAGGQSKIEQLHDMLNRAEISDQQIRGGVNLTQIGKNKVAARLGIGPHDVTMYLNSLIQQLRNEDEDSIEQQLQEQYWNAVNVIDEDDDETEGPKIKSGTWIDAPGRPGFKDKPGIYLTTAGSNTAYGSFSSTAEAEAYNRNRLGGKFRVKVNEEAGQPKRPFEQAERFSFEPDALGSMTARDVTTGRSRFVQGAQASSLLRRLEAPGANRQAILAPLFEKAPLPDSKPSFWPEIEAKSGSYNFTWKLGSQHGTGTVMFHADADSPDLELVDVRDEAGDEMDVDAGMHQELLDQARIFLGNE
jgi:hypothetical protein